jgi:molecular chaperone DnaJ
MSSKSDYYEILEIKKNATNEEIKKAYREMALRHHPDRVPVAQKKQAEDRFKEISEAYAVLSDPRKRALYDQHGHAGIDQKYAYEDIYKGTDFGSVFEGLGDFGLGGGIFDNLFGDLGVDLFSARGRRKPQAGAPGGRRGRDLEIAVSVTLDEAYRGAEKTVTVPRYESCPACAGSGAKPGTPRMPCPDCRGTGKKAVPGGIFQMAQSCPRCGGSGTIARTPCSSCRGDGRVKTSRNLAVTIPPGVDNGSRLRMKGEGEPGDTVKHDLYVTIEVEPHPVFERKGNDLHTEITVRLPKAMLGAELQVPSFDGDVMMKIPPGTQSGSVFRLRGKGMPELRGRGVGDEMVTVKVEIPSRLNDRQRKLVEELEKSMNE